MLSIDELMEIVCTEALESAPTGSDLMLPAISLTQPWATLAVLLEKRIETRSWATKFRGPIAWHAAKTFPGWARRQCWIPPFSYVLARHNLTPDDLPVGKVIAITEITDCLPTEKVREAFCCYSEALYEELFGDYSDGRFAFLLGEMKPIRPVPAKGALRIWKWRRGA